MDEDGQHDPEAIGALLDTAMAEQADIITRATNEPPHGALRNVASRGAKWFVDRLAKGADASAFSSFRLVLGEVARSVAAYAGPGIYPRRRHLRCLGREPPGHLPGRDAQRGRPPSGYTFRRLVSHFWRLVLSSGTRPLRWVSAVGAAAVLLAPVVAARARRRAGQRAVARARLDVDDDPAHDRQRRHPVQPRRHREYVGLAVNMAMGKPLYLPVRDRREGPLGRDRA